MRLNVLLIGTALFACAPILACKHTGMGEHIKHPLADQESSHMHDIKKPMNSTQDIQHKNHNHDNHSHHGTIAKKNTLKLSLTPQGPLEAGITTKVIATLTSAVGDKTFGDADLKEAHTQKLHFLVINPSLTDYHHIHPIATGKQWTFNFTPKKNDNYRVWADVIPITTGKQEYVMADMGTAPKNKAIFNKTTHMISTVDGYTFTLTLNSQPKVGNALMSNITVTKDGKPFNQLEPVMGAFAHMVGFTEDYQSVLHIHPLGNEPTSATEHGGSKLEFHIEPKKAGFVKLFTQVRINGKDVFAQFGLTVK